MSLYTHPINSNHEQTCEQSSNQITNMWHTAGSLLLKTSGSVKINLETETQPQWDSECDQLKLVKV